jgi:hypothetical protein
VTVRGDLALIVMAGLVVVRQTTWLSPSPSSMAKVVSKTKIVRVRRALARPSPTR